MSSLPLYQTSCDLTQPAASARKRRDLVEVAVALSLILLAVWTPRPLQQVFSLVALAWVLFSTGRSMQRWGEGWADMGFRAQGYLRSLWVVLAAAGLAAIAVAVAEKMNTLHVPEFPTLFVRRYWAYAIWALLQEFLLLDFFLLRFLRLFRDPKIATLAAAALFALTHLPNPVLTPVTLVWGYVACLTFLAYRNLYTPALAHAILGICIAVTIPGTVDHNMRVGLGYLTYRPHVQRSQSDHTVSTPAWVKAEAPTRRP